MFETRLKKTVNLSRVKELVRKLPKDHPLRPVFEAEDTDIDVEEFVSKVKTWVRLLS